MTEQDLIIECTKMRARITPESCLKNIPVKHRILFVVGVVLLILVYFIFAWWLTWEPKPCRAE